MTGVPDSPVDRWVLFPSAEITASVQVAPVPEIPPAALREILVPHHSIEGRLDDWLIGADAIADEHNLAPYWEWRSKWTRSWPMGPQANLTALLHYAEALDHEIGASLSGLLQRLASMVDDEELLSVMQPSAIDTLLGELDALRSVIASAGLQGIGIVDDTPSGHRRTGMARTWPPPLTEQTLVADRSTALVLRPGDDLVLMYGGPHYESLPDVVSVDLVNEPAIVTSRRGDRVELAPAAARPHGWLVPHALAWHLRALPLVTVWSPVFAGLPEAIGVAQRVGSSVVFSVTSPIA